MTKPLAMPGWDPADLASLTPPEDLQVSPSGHVVVYAQKTHDAASGRYRSQIWQCRDGAALPLTPGPGDHLPRLSPDGTILVFARDDEAGSRLMRMDLNGGDVEALSFAAATITELVWHPQGETVAILVRPGAGAVQPSAATEIQADAQSRRILTGESPEPGSPVEVWVYDVRRGSGRPWPVAGLRHRMAMWLADGSLVTVAGESDRPSARDRFYRLRADHDPVAWTAFRGTITAASVSPRGDCLAYAAVAADENPVLTAPRLYGVAVTAPDVPTPLAVTTLWDRPVAGAFPSDVAPEGGRRLAFSPDGSRLYAVVANEGGSDVYCWADGAESPLRVADVPATVFDLAPVQEGFWMVGSTPMSPPEVYRWQGRSEQVTHLAGAWLERHPPRPAEPFAVDGSRFAIAGWRVLPSGSGPFPTVLLVHGGPGHAFGPSFHGGAQMLASHGYLVLMANPRGSASYGDMFAQSVMGDIGGGDFHDLMAVLDEHAAAGLADAARLAIVGWLYGGYMAAWAITQTNRFAAAVIATPITDLMAVYGTGHPGLPDPDAVLGGAPWELGELYHERSPLAHAGRVQTPALFLVEAGPPCEGPAQAHPFYAAIRGLGIPTALVQHPRRPSALAESSVPPARWRWALDWITYWLGSR